MTKGERLCLPLCGTNLTLLHPFEEPGYDAIDKIVGESILEQLNSYAVKTNGEKTFTQLGAPKNEIEPSSENGLFENEEHSSLKTNVEANNEECNILGSVDSKKEGALFQLETDSDHTGSIDAAINLESIINNTQYYMSILGSTENLTNVQQQGELSQQNLREIDELSKELLLTSELAEKTFEPPVYTPPPVIVKRKKKKSTIANKETNARKGKTGKKQNKGEICPEENNTEPEGEEKTNDIEKDKNQELVKEPIEEAENDDNAVLPCGSNAILTEELPDPILSQSFSGTTSTLEDSNGNVSKLQPKNHICREDVDNLLELIDPSNDIESNTFLNKSENKKSVPEKRLDEGVTLNTGLLTNMENLAAACLPDAYDLWKEKYRSMVEEEYPDANCREVEGRLKEIWCKIPDEHRKRYYDKAEKLVRRYSVSAAFSYMNRFKCSTSRCPKGSRTKGRPAKEPPPLLHPKPLRIKKKEIGQKEESRIEEEETEKDIDDFLTNFDYSKVMRETATYNSPADKRLRKKLGKMKEIQQDEGELDFTDENTLATGVLMDIMMSNDTEEERDEEQLTWSTAHVPEMTKMNCLDISALDDYLGGKESPFGEGMERGKTKKPSARKKRANNKLKKNESEKTKK